eukprot:TRINITY_DN8163_c0_g1_i1.p1 TRINITY_DN8163_c0_g1~~TRINITY_DN8163_c0_g1_i1.p1  ORF type:complete len:244 (+),score=51.58 TRINITY_DN8163_c0_g1_i1:26-757(+)
MEIESNSGLTKQFGSWSTILVDDNRVHRGPSSEEEKKLTRKGIRFIEELGIKMEAGRMPISTACILFHRFHQKKPIKNEDIPLVGATCVYLATKLEEDPKRLRDIINTSYMMQYNKQLMIGTEYWKERDRVVEQELALLSTLAFDVTVELPYKYLLNYLKALNAKHALAQLSWNLLNDSFETTISLTWRPHVVAVSCIYLASKFLKLQLDSSRWWETFDVSLEQINSISNTILELYVNNDTTS